MVGCYGATRLVKAKGYTDMMEEDRPKSMVHMPYRPV